MAVFSALVFILIGGLVNGSFALPTKSIQQWNFENIWINYGFWAFFILPWIAIFSLAPNVGMIYQHIPGNALLMIIIGGILFGIGQACFAQCLRLIGFGLGFLINVGMGTGLGFLLPLVIFHPEKILTPFGLATLIGALLIIAGLVISYYAGKQRDDLAQKIKQSEPSRQYQLGVVLAIVAGLGSAFQNLTFAATGYLQTTALNAGVNHLAASMIIWPVFLTFSFICYAAYMLYLHRKNNSFINYFGPKSSLNFFLSLVMGLLWFIPLILYSQASLLIGGLGPVVGWPLFMVVIILISNFWGWRHHEWAHATDAVKRQALSAIGLLILAVGVLAYSATLS